MTQPSESSYQPTGDPAADGGQPYWQPPTRPVPDDGPGDDRGERSGAGAYVTSGILLLLYGLVPFAWIGYGMAQTDTMLLDVLRQVADPAEPAASWMLTPWEWAFGVALLVVGIAMIAAREAVRGGALLLAVLLLGLSLREGVGLFDAEYRAGFTDTGEGQWLLATRAVGLLVAIVVIALCAKVRQRSQASLPSAALTAAGVVIAVCGLLALVDVVRAMGEGYGGSFFRDAVDPTEFGGSPDMVGSANAYFYLATAIAMLVIGVLAMARRRVSRSAGVTLMGVLGFVHLYYAVLPSLQTGAWSRFGDVFVHTIALGTVIGALVVFVLLGIAKGAPAEASQDVVLPSAYAEYGGQSYGGYDAGGQSYGDQSYGGQSYGGHDAGGHDAGGQSYGGQSYGGYDAGGQSYGGHDAGGTTEDSSAYRWPPS